MYILNPTVVLLFLFFTTNIWCQSGELDSLKALIQELRVQNDDTTEGIQDSLPLSIGELYFLLGKTQYKANLYQEAEKSYQQALALKRASLGANTKDLALVYEALSTVEERLGRYDLALRYQQLALNIHMKYLDPSSSQVMNNYYNLSNLYEEQWQLDSAEITVEKGMEIALDLFGESHPNLARGYQLKGDIYNARKSYIQAETFYKTALSIYELAGDKVKLRSVYNNLAIAFMSQERFDEAIEYYQKSIEMAKQLESDVLINTSIGLYNIGLCYKRMEEYEVAIDYINQAKVIWEEILGSEHPYVGRAFSLLSDTYTMLEKNDTAIDYSLRSLEILRNNYGEKHPLTAQQYYVTGLIYNNREEFQNGLDYNQKAIIRVCHTFANEDPFSNPTIADISSKETFLEIITAKIFSFFHFWEQDGDLEKLKAALEAAEMGIATMEAMREEFGVWNDSKSLLNSIYLHIYKSAMRISHELATATNAPEYLEKAFEIAEKNKAVLLLEAMQSVEAKAAVDFPQSITDQEETLIDKIAELEQQIRQLNEAAAAPDLLAVAQTELLETNRTYEVLVRQIRKEFPKFHQLKYDHSVASTSDIQAMLDEETLFVEYILKTNESSGEIDGAAIYIITISAQETTIEKAPYPADLSEKVTRFYRLFSNPSVARVDQKRRFVSLSNELYQCLIQPIEAQIQDKSKLILVAESVLNYLPFGALLPEISEKPYNQLPFLIKDFDISYYYSGTLRQRMANKKARDFQGDLLAFAPVFDNVNLASVTARHQAEAVDTTFRTFTADGKFDPLPFTANEVRSIHDLFEKNQKTDNLLLLHDQAEEATLKEKLEAGYQFVHVASHSFANLAHPKFSGIACIQKEDAKEDGILYVNEIYQLNLNSDLIVLSSCESGFGKLIEGEGILGLNRSFVYAGAPNVVFSLYKIQDNITNEFMVNFYHSILADKQTYAAALRQAKLALLSDRVTASPYYWAGFLLVGQGG